mmetsp:Transcript_7319/g.11143  ORF Transcript_7319/g.11143 Transcript_7319/m.11143 type:complete len:91 (-) Transcript_7319:566-838(-)
MKEMLKTTLGKIAHTAAFAVDEKTKNGQMNTMNRYQHRPKMCAAILGFVSCAYGTTLLYDNLMLALRSLNILRPALAPMLQTNAIREGLP